MPEEKPRVRVLFPASDPTPPPKEAEPVRPAVLRFDEERVEYQADLNATGDLVMRPGTLKNDPPPQPLRFDRPPVEHPADCACGCSEKKARIKPLFTPTETIPETPVQVGPTALALPGVRIRHRIEVDQATLRTQNPDAPADVLSRATEILIVTNLEDATSARFLEVGIESQERFASASRKLLSISADPRFDEINRGLREMAAKMAASGLEQLTSEPSRWKSWFEGKPSFEEVKTTIKSMVEEVADRSDHMLKRIPELRGLSREASELRAELQTCAILIDVDSAVARYLISHLQKTPEKEFYAEWVEALLRRADSISLTRLTLKQAVLQLRLVDAHLRHLTEIVQAALINMVPAWCGNCASLLTRARQDKASESAREVAALATVRDQIVGLMTKETEN